MHEFTRILIADDHSILRGGLRLILEQQPDFQVVAEAADGREAISLAERVAPSVCVLDVAMPNLNGIEAARQIISRSPSTAIVVLSMHSDESYVLRALKAGARAYLLKESAAADLITAIRAVLEGKTYFSPAVKRLLIDDSILQLRLQGGEDSVELLTPREREILQLVAEGKSNKDIARMLYLSVYTVETHRSNILEKLDLHTIPDLILYAVRKGIIH